MGRARVRSILVTAVSAVTLATLAACTIATSDPPPLQGPSELGLSITLFANPDVLTQDGASQSQIVVQARDANGTALADVPVRAEIFVGGVLADFGRLSARTLVTGRDGRAATTYTAPAPPPEPVDTFTIVSIVVTPSASNFANTTARYVDIRLVPPGIILPPAGTPTPEFSFSPALPAQGDAVQFDASASTPGDNAAIASYRWDFGDGTTGSGVRVSHTYATSGNYTVTLTVTNTRSRSASTSQSVPVQPTTAPTAIFSVSPTTPEINESVFVNGSASTASAGRRIVSYDWTFGNGRTASGVTATTRYTVPGIYAITLTVTDDLGRTGSASQTVAVGTQSLPFADFVFSPTDPQINQTVQFDASLSRAPSGRTIVAYEWNFGDGARGAGRLISHAYGTVGTYSVVLTVTDSAGARSSASRTVPVGQPTGGPSASFTFSPQQPTVNQTVNFDGSASTAPTGRTIVTYEWNFGDGSPLAFGVRVSHAYTTAGDYNVVLTVTDSLGARASTTNRVSVTSPSAAAPTAAFTVSPTRPVVGQNVNFDATQSTAPAGRTLTTYEWTFGDGTTATCTIPAAPGDSPNCGPTRRTITKVGGYSAAGEYTAVLRVVDNSGASGTTSQRITVDPISGQNPTASFNVSPNPAPVNQPVVADAAPSTAQGGATIVKYTWNWGDSAANEVCSNPAASGDNANCGGNNRQTISHVYTRTGTFTITLIVTDSAGRTGSATRSIVIQ